MSVHPLPDTEAQAVVAIRPRRARNIGMPLLFGSIGMVLLGVGYGAGRYAERTAQINSVCVLINNIPITEKAFQHRLETAGGSDLLRQMTEEELRLQFARNQGVYPTDTEVEARLEEKRQMPDYAAKLAANHQTEEDIRHSLRVEAAQQNVLTRGVTVSERDVKAFYNSNVSHNNPQARYYHPETVQVAAIVTASEAEARRALVALAGGQAFAEVARAMSADPSAANGGVMPPFQQGRTNLAEFPGLERLVFSLQTGQQTDAQKIGASWWVLRCLSRTPETQLEFDKVREDCRTGAMLTKVLPMNAQHVNAEFAAFRKSAAITVVRPEYKDVVLAR